MSDWEEEFEAEPVVSTRPKMSWDDEDADDNEVNEDWDESGSDLDEEVAGKSETKKEEPKSAPLPKKGLTLKQKIAEKEIALKEQKKKKAALANRFMEGETEEERFERAQKEAGIEKKEFAAPAEDAPKKAAKPVESCKPRTRADFEEFKKLLIDLILEKSGNPAYPAFLEQFARDVSAPMKDMDVRKAASSLTALANDKARQNKEALKTSKKTKGKAQPAAAKPAASSREYSTTYDDFDDFM